MNWNSPRRRRRRGHDIIRTDLLPASHLSTRVATSLLNQFSCAHAAFAAAYLFIAAFPFVATRTKRPEMADDVAEKTVRLATPGHRWWILLLFCLNGCLNNAIWLTFDTISVEAIEFFSTSQAMVVRKLIEARDSDCAAMPLSLPLVCLINPWSCCFHVDCSGRRIFRTPSVF